VVAAALGAPKVKLEAAPKLTAGVVDVLVGVAVAAGALLLGASFDADAPNMKGAGAGAGVDPASVFAPNMKGAAAAAGAGADPSRFVVAAADACPNMNGAGAGAGAGVGTELAGSAAESAFLSVADVLAGVSLFALAPNMNGAGDGVAADVPALVSFEAPNEKPVNPAGFVPDKSAPFEELVAPNVIGSDFAAAGAASSSSRCDRFRRPSSLSSPSPRRPLLLESSPDGVAVGVPVGAPPKLNPPNGALEAAGFASSENGFFSADVKGPPTALPKGPVDFSGLLLAAVTFLGIVGIPNPKAAPEFVDFIGSLVRSSFTLPESFSFSVAATPNENPAGFASFFASEEVSPCVDDFGAASFAPNPKPKVGAAGVAAGAADAVTPNVTPAGGAGAGAGDTPKVKPLAPPAPADPLEEVPDAPQDDDGFEAAGAGAPLPSPRALSQDTHFVADLSLGTMHTGHFILLLANDIACAQAELADGASVTSGAALLGCSVPKLLAGPADPEPENALSHDTHFAADFSLGTIQTSHFFLSLLAARSHKDGAALFSVAVFTTFCTSASPDFTFGTVAEAAADLTAVLVVLRWVCADAAGVNTYLIGLSEPPI
jgi:hypothetical protein